MIILKSKFFLDDPPSLLLVSAPDYLSWLLAEQSFNRLGFWRPSGDEQSSGTMKLFQNDLTDVRSKKVSPLEVMNDLLDV